MLKRNVRQQLARKKTAVDLHSCQSVVGVCVLSKCKESHRSTAEAGEPIPGDLFRSNGLSRNQSGTVKTRRMERSQVVTDTAQGGVPVTPAFT